MSNELVNIRQTETAGNKSIDPVVSEIIDEINVREKELVGLIEHLSPGHRFGVKKMEHAVKMADEAIVIAQNFNLDNKDTQLLRLTFRTHDIGRSLSVVRNEVNDGGKHGEWAVEWLNTNKVLEKLSADDRKIVEFAVKYHSTKEVPEVDQNDSVMKKAYDFCYILRDHDKVEVLEKAEFTDDPKTVVRIKGMYGLSDETKSSDEIMDLFFNQKTIDNKLMKTYGDFVLLHLSYMFDIKKQGTKNYLKNNKIDGIDSRIAYITKNQPEILSKVQDTIDKVLS